MGMIDVEAAARLLGVTPQEIYRLIRRGRVESFGGKLVVVEEQIQKLKEVRNERRPAVN